MTSQGSRWWLALVGALVGGCTQFVEVEEACHPSGRVPGADEGSLEDRTLDRMNCFRRVSGLGRARVAPSIQDALVGHASYIQQNPAADRLLGDDGPSGFLTQNSSDPGFTGTRATARYEREGYTFSDPDGTSVREFLFLAVGGEGEPFTDEAGNPLSGPQAMDDLMRQADFREVAMQRSWVDGGYTEIDLDADWWTRGELCDVRSDLCVGGSVPNDFVGRLYYLAVVHADPPAQRSLLPFSYPKLDQVGVPLFSRSFDLGDADPLTGIGAPVQISYPVSIFGNASDPDTADLDAQNVYGLSIDGARIENEGGQRFVTKVVLPGDDAEGVFPAGTNLNRSAAVYIDRPFQPSTTYTFTGELTTNEAIYDVEFSFTTADSDPGVVQPGNAF